MQLYWIDNVCLSWLQIKETSPYYLANIQSYKKTNQLNMYTLSGCGICYTEAHIYATKTLFKNYSQQHDSINLNNNYWEKQEAIWMKYSVVDLTGIWGYIYV